MKKYITTIFIIISFFGISLATNIDTPKNTGALEMLTFEVPVNDRETFLKLDKDIWTNYLSSFKSFKGKKILLDDSDSDSLIVLVYWSSANDLYKIRYEHKNEIDELTKEFEEQTNYKFKMTNAKVYKVYS